MTPSKLLISEPPLIVLPTLALTYGIEKALVIQQIYWLINNGNENVVELSGVKHVRIDYAKWIDKYFRFWKVPTLRHHIAELEAIGVVTKYLFSSGRNGTKKFIAIDHSKLLLTSKEKMVDYIDMAFTRITEESELVRQIKKKVNNREWQDACLLFAKYFPNSRFNSEWIGRNGTNILEFISALKGRESIIQSAVDLAKASASDNPMFTVRHPRMLAKYLDNAANANARQNDRNVKSVIIGDDGKIQGNVVKI